MVDAACRPILANQNWANCPYPSSCCAALLSSPHVPVHGQAWCTTSKKKTIHCAIRQSLDRQRWSTFHVELAETGVLHLEFIYWCTNASPKAKKIHHNTPACNQRPTSAQPRQQTACNLTPSMPVSHSPGLACNLTRLHLNPIYPIQRRPASRSINQSIDQCLSRYRHRALRLVPAHPAPALRRSTSSALGAGWEASRAPPNWYHVDGNLASKTRSNHPNGVVGVALGFCWSYSIKGRGSMQDRHPFPRYAKRHRASCDGDGERGKTNTHTNTGPAQCGRVPSSMSWCPSPLVRCTIEPVCDRFTTRRTKPPGAPSQPRTGMSPSCNFVLAC